MVPAASPRLPGGVYRGGMRPRRSLPLVVILAAVLSVPGLLAGSAPAQAAPAATPAPDSNYRYAVTLTRVSNARPVVVSWGDGTTSRRTSACSPAKAASRPSACSMRLRHSYAGPGTYQVTLKFGGKVIDRMKARVWFAPNGWQPPAGWVQPAGWKPYGDGATFAPCSTVRWFYDASAQPAASAGMRVDVALGLDLLAQRTGLTFVETADRGQAQLVYGWADLAGQYGGDVGGVGGRDRDSAYVRFSTTNWWPADSWPGFSIVTQPDGRQAAGRGWLVLHETMHALGFDHVDDPTEVMNPVITASAFGAGDLDGLQTMYLSQPCGS